MRIPRRFEGKIAVSVFFSVSKAQSVPHIPYSRRQNDSALATRMSLAAMSWLSKGPAHQESEMPMAGSGAARVHAHCTSHSPRTSDQVCLWNSAEDSAVLDVCAKDDLRLGLGPDSARAAFSCRAARRRTMVLVMAFLSRLGFFLVHAFRCPVTPPAARGRAPPAQSPCRRSEMQAPIKTGKPPASCTLAHHTSRAVLACSRCRCRAPKTCCTRCFRAVHARSKKRSHFRCCWRAVS
jgi:hypothetical protein